MTDNRFINKALPSYQDVLGDEAAGSKLILKFLGNYECGVTLLFSISLTSSFFVCCLFVFLFRETVPCFCFSSSCVSIILQFSRREIWFCCHTDQQGASAANMHPCSCFIVWTWLNFGVWIKWLKSAWYLCSLRIIYSVLLLFSKFWSDKSDQSWFVSSEEASEKRVAVTKDRSSS